jgi:hypothetical protein
MTSAEFAEWIAMDQLEPGEPMRSDYHAAMICHTLAVINRKKGHMPKLKSYHLQYLLESKAQMSANPDATLKQKLLGWKVAYDAHRDREVSQK